MPRLRFLRPAVTLLVLWLALLGTPASAYAAKTIALSSGSFSFTVDPGGTGQGEVTVINDGDEPLKALVYVADVQVDAEGNQTYTAPQRQGAGLMTTPASWFRLWMPEHSKSLGNTPYVELAPKQRVPIKFEFAPPSGTAPGDHNAVLFFEMFELTDASSGSNAQVTGRLGTRIALRVNGRLVEKLSIRPMAVPGFVIGGGVPYRFTVNNEGNVNDRVAITATLLDSNERAIASSAVTTETVVFADAGYQFSGKVSAPAQKLGRHTLEVKLSYMRDGEQVATDVVEDRSVWLVPLWVVVLAGFIVAYAIGFAAVRALKKRRERREASAARRRSHKQREAEADERRRRREERAAEASAFTGEGAPDGDDAGTADE